MKKALLPICLVLIAITFLFLTNRNSLENNNSSTPPISHNPPTTSTSHTYANSYQVTSEPDEPEEAEEPEGEVIGFLLLETKDDPCSKVTVNGYYGKPNSLQDENIIMLEGLSSGEFVEFIVDGEIRDFEHIELSWNDEKCELVETQVINSFDKLIDQTILISTYMPEGIPREKIKWKDISGISHEFIITEHSLAGE